MEALFFMKKNLIAILTLIQIFLSSQTAFAATDVITNGSFEAGLAGWTAANNLAAGAAGTGGYNGDTAPGTETITGNAGLAATDGTKIALGSVKSTSGGIGIITSVLYQDVAIPAGATTATYTFDIGVKNIVNPSDRSTRVGIYPTGAVPSWTDLTIAGASVVWGPFVADAALQSKSSAINFNVSALAGTTVRFAILNAANFNGKEVIVVDNVKFMVNAGPVIPTLNEWGMIIFLILMALSVLIIMKRRISVKP
jgi:hypothetical protein